MMLECELTSGVRSFINFSVNEMKKFWWEFKKCFINGTFELIERNACFKTFINTKLLSHSLTLREISHFHFRLFFVLFFMWPFCYVQRIHMCLSSKVYFTTGLSHFRLNFDACQEISLDHLTHQLAYYKLLLLFCQQF